MKLMKTYSHLNGMEYLQVRRAKTINEIKAVIKSVDAKKHLMKNAKKHGEMIYSPSDINKEFEQCFTELGWESKRREFYVTEDETLARRIVNLPACEQKKEILSAGCKPYLAYTQIDFAKDRVAVVVQFEKHSSVAHDLYVKHTSFFVGDMIDVGIEIIPMRCLQEQTLSSVPYFEDNLFNIIRHDRSIPVVPLVLIGIGP